MKPQSRENLRYAQGQGESFSIEEQLLFDRLYTKVSRDFCLKGADLGCGTGKTIAYLQNHYTNASFHGLDFSSIAIEKALTSNISAQVYDLDSDLLPFDANSLQLITALDVIEHVFDPIGLLRNCYSSLCPSGSIWGIVPNDIHYLTRIRVLLGISPVSRTYRKLGINKHHTPMSSELIRYLLMSAGFESANIKLFFSAYLLPNLRGHLPFGFHFPSSFFPGSILFSAHK